MNNSTNEKTMSNLDKQKSPLKSEVTDKDAVSKVSISAMRASNRFKLSSINSTTLKK